MKAFDKANLKRPEFTAEQGGVTANIYREIFMSVSGDAKSNQTDIEPIQTEQNTRKATHKLGQTEMPVHIENNVRHSRERQRRSTLVRLMLGRRVSAALLELCGNCYQLGCVASQQSGSLFDSYAVEAEKNSPIPQLRGANATLAVAYQCLTANAVT